MSNKEQRKIFVDKRNRSLKRVSIISTILFIVVVLAFNILFDSLLGKKLQWDWSTGELYSIGDVSKGILNNLKLDVQIIGLFDKTNDTVYTDFRKLLDDYAAKSNGRITLRYVDPDANPAILTEIDPDGYLDLDTAVFVVYCPSTKKAKPISDDDLLDVQYDQTTGQQVLAGITAEESFTGAIKFVQSENTPTLYFSSGHDEIDYATSYSALVSIMQNNNFQVKPLDMFGIGAIPADCAVLIIAEPQKDITQLEKGVIGDYLKSGGSLMFIAGYGNTRFPVLNQLLADYNLEVSNTKIREGDVNYRLQNDEYFIRVIAPVSTFVTSTIDGQIVMENTRGMNILSNTSSLVVAEPILTTSLKGIAETDGDIAQSSAPATQNVAVLSENKSWIDGKDITVSAKVMLFGSSSMFLDEMLTNNYTALNANIFYASVTWMSNAEPVDDLMIKAKDPISYALTSGTLGAWNLASFFCFLILPIILLIIALVVYRKRKNL